MTFLIGLNTMTFNEWWYGQEDTPERNKTNNLYGLQKEAWDARQPEIDELKRQLKQTTTRRDDKWED